MSGGRWSRALALSQRPVAASRRRFPEPHLALSRAPALCRESRRQPPHPRPTTATRSPRTVRRPSAAHSRRSRRLRPPSAVSLPRAAGPDAPPASSAGTLARLPPPPASPLVVRSLVRPRGQLGHRVVPGALDARARRSACRSSGLGGARSSGNGRWGAVGSHAPHGARRRPRAADSFRCKGVHACDCAKCARGGYLGRPLFRARSHGAGRSRHDFPKIPQSALWRLAECGQRLRAEGWDERIGACGCDGV